MTSAHVLLVSGRFARCVIILIFFILGKPKALFPTLLIYFPLQLLGEQLKLRKTFIFYSTWQKKKFISNVILTCCAFFVSS